MKVKEIQEGRHMRVILALGRSRQEGKEFKIILNYVGSLRLA